MKDLERARLHQARASLDEALALLESGMDAGIALTNLYYAFYYPVLALVYEGRVPETMQSVTLGLFDRRFIETGMLKKEYSAALHRVFESKPKCSGERTAVPRDEMLALLDVNRAFIIDVEGLLGPDHGPQGKGERRTP